MPNWQAFHLFFHGVFPVFLPNLTYHKNVGNGMKQFLKYTTLALTLFSQTAAQAQAVDNNGVEHNINNSRYVRFNYGNDYFTATDYYLTQTVLLEFAHPELRKNPLTKLMSQPKNYQLKFGLAAEQNGYTPTDYVPKEILYGDRPFAGTLSLKTFVVATDTLRKQRISTSLNVGVLGPLAGAGDIQTYIHERTPNAVPQGWPNQIANDIVLNYCLSYERQLFALSNYLNLSATGMAKAGTISTKASVGLTLMGGIFNNPYNSLVSKKKRVQVYVYDHPELNAVAYDATLQGGLFNRSSPYTIPAADVNRVVFRNNFGIVGKFGNVYLEYYQSFMTKEFATGLDMKNGGIQIGVGF